MSIWNKVLLGLIAFASLFFFYEAMRTLKTHQNWRDLVRKLEQKRDGLEKEIRGDKDSPGLEAKVKQAQSDLKKLVNERGRAWRNCLPGAANQQTGQVSVATSQPDTEPHGIDDKLVLYVFEEPEGGKGGQYIGEFTVELVDKKQVGLKPSRPLTPREFQRLTQSSQAKKPWTLYERMPFDNHVAFSDPELTEEQKKALLPAETASEFLRDGQPATWEQVDESKLAGTVVEADEDGKPKLGGKPLLDDAGNKKPGKGVYVRRLRDYKTLFDWYATQRSALADLITFAENDLKLLQNAVADGQKDIEFQKKEIGTVTAELADRRKELGAIAAHYEAVKQKTAKILSDLNVLLQSNQTKAVELTRLQAQAVKLIDQRTGSMAQTGDSVR